MFQAERANETLADTPLQGLRLLVHQLGDWRGEGEGEGEGEPQPPYDSTSPKPHVRAGGRWTASTGWCSGPTPTATYLALTLFLPGGMS
jgi:hypothetical protein